MSDLLTGLAAIILLPAAFAFLLIAIDLWSRP